MKQPLTQAYLYDRVADTMTRVSTSYDDWPGGSTNSFVSVSADGSSVSYLSDRWDTVDDVLAPNVLVWARATGDSSFVSTAANGTPGNNTSSAPSISADGDHIVFVSLARNLPHGIDKNKAYDAYLWTAPAP
jgi:Tol biopolymer transport system component